MAAYNNPNFLSYSSEDQEYKMVPTGGWHELESSKSLHYELHVKEGKYYYFGPNRWSTKVATLPKPMMMSIVTWQIRINIKLERGIFF